MEQSATTNYGAGDALQNEVKEEQSLSRIVFLLSWSRYMSVIAGAGFVLFESIEIFLLGWRFSPEVVAEIFMFLLFGTVFVWFTTKWGEKLTLKASQTQQDLIHANQVARHEISERKKAEEALQDTAAELARVNGGLESEIAERMRIEQSLREHTDELARSNSELQQFAHVASHDLQEPLRMVSSYTQLLARRYKGKLDSDADDFIGFAVDGVSRMQNLIEDLLAFSRVGSKAEDFKPTDFNAVFEEVTSNLKATIQDNNASVTHDDLPTINADSSQIMQLFQNLVGNAIKFIGNGQPCVHVSANLDNGEWKFSVSDNGIGIELEYAERIFVIFQRLHTWQEYSGTGIGLAICKKIVERHGGQIWLESEPGSGATFHFTIPADRS